jgi:23S rRNA pseudouridine1911/1915/1917 synthase
MNTEASITNPASQPVTGDSSHEFRTHELALPAAVAGMRLDQALAQVLPQYSRERLKSWIGAGAVKVDGALMKPSGKVLGGEHVRIEARIEVDTRVLAEAIPLEVVHRDRALLVVNKPAGLVVHPGAGNSQHTLQNALLALDPKLKAVPRAGLVHRLDKDTSGLVLVARTLESHTALVAALARREIERHYLAVCTGVMTGGGTVDEPIGRDVRQRTRMAVSRGGREAVTHYRVVQRFRAHTLIRAELETGRTHQIRVHLAYIGYPLVGDPLYAGRRRIPAGCSPALIAELTAFSRQALHAARLLLAHPLSGKEVEWEAPLPADMTQLLKVLESDARAVQEK